MSGCITYMINLHTSHDKFQKYTLLIYYFSFTPPEGTGPAGYQDDLTVYIHYAYPLPGDMQIQIPYTLSAPLNFFISKGAVPLNL